MPARSFEIGRFDVSDADNVHYRSGRLGQDMDYGKPEVGEVIDNICRLEFESPERLHGLKVFYECHAGHAESSEDGLDLHKVIWQVSARDAYWHHAAKDTPEYTDQMAPGIYDQSKQSAYSGRTAGGSDIGADPSSELEKFIDLGVLATVPIEFDAGDAIAAHVRVSKDSGSMPADLIARTTFIAYTEDIGE